MAVTTLATLYLIFKTNQLNTQLSNASQPTPTTEESYIYPPELENADALLFSGEYDEAVRAYQKQLDQIDHRDLARAVQVHMELARQLRNQQSETPLEKDTLSRQVVVIKPTGTEEEVRVTDSLNFALDKAYLQINYLKRQLKQDTRGAYLTFNTSKGKQAHYVGQVKDKMANGTGVALLNTGSRYTGEWKNNLRHGRGTFHWPDGEYYEGLYKDDKRHGLGTYHWPNGEKFIGQWENDQRNGEGTFYGEKGIIKGMWKDDELEKVYKQ